MKSTSNILSTPRRCRATFALTLALLVFLSSSGFCDDGAGKTVDRLSKWSLLFGIGSNLTLTNFEGVMISAKRAISSDRAWRVVVLMRGSARAQTDDNFYYSYNQTDSRRHVDDNYWKSDIGVSYLAYIKSTRQIRVYTGAGPRFAYSRHLTEVAYSNLGESYYAWRKDATYQREIDVGATVYLGVEWSVIPSIGLMAEYGADLGYSWLRSERDIGGASGRISKSDNDTFELDSSPVKFGLAVYF